jgi:hypothetical protein
VRYFEFDLSGNFEPQNRYNATAIEKLPAQVITLVSNTGVTVNVSDTELQSNKVTADSYTFMPSYLNEELTEGYVLNNDGSAYTALSGSTTKKIQAFRPFFTKTTAGTGGNAPAFHQITFSREIASLQDKDIVPDLSDNIAENINISSRRGKIVVTSEMRDEADVQIYTTSGMLIDSYNIKPGETIETRVNISGIYIVQTADGVYTKKLSVK